MLNEKTVMETYLEKSLQERRDEFERFQIKYPMSIPMFIDVSSLANKNENCHRLKKNKFLVPRMKKIKIKDEKGNVVIGEDGNEKTQESIMTIGDVMATTRAYMMPDAKGRTLTKEESLFFHIHNNDGIMLSSDLPLVEAVKRYAAEDGFLYIVYSTETVMGHY